MESVEIKEKVRPFLGRFEGYLKGMPNNWYVRDPAIWEHYNSDVEKISQITENSDYNKFIIKAVLDGSEYYVDGNTLKFKLSGLIEDLKAYYFNDESRQENSAGIHISQNQSQTQGVHIQILLDMQSLIEKKMQNFPKESKERTFLENMKESLSSMKDVSDLFNTTVTTAKMIGLTVEELYKIFS